MAYSEKSAARLAALHGEIEARKEHEFAAPTYRDTAALAEIRQTVFNQLESEHEHDRDTVEDSIAVLRYLAENYENMGRTACALPLRKKVLELDAELAARFKNREGIESDYYCALKARNRYGRDECADLRELAAHCGNVLSASSLSAGCGFRYAFTLKQRPHILRSCCVTAVQQFP